MEWINSYLGGPLYSHKVQSLYFFTTAQVYAVEMRSSDHVFNMVSTLVLLLFRIRILVLLEVWDV